MASAYEAMGIQKRKKQFLAWFLGEGIFAKTLTNMTILVKFRSSMNKKQEKLGQVSQIAV